jgi:hypothetical protein
VRLVQTIITVASLVRITDSIVVASRRTLAVRLVQTIATVASLVRITDSIVVASRRALATRLVQTVSTLARLVRITHAIVITIFICLTSVSTVTVRARAVLKVLADIIGNAAVVRARGQGHALKALEEPLDTPVSTAVGSQVAVLFRVTGQGAQAIAVVHITQGPATALMSHTACRVQHGVAHSHTIAIGRGLVTTISTSHVVIAHPLALVFGETRGKVKLPGTVTVLLLRTDAQHAARIAHIAHGTFSKRVRKSRV